MSYQVIDPFLEFTNPANGQPIGIGSVYFGRPDSDPKNQPSNRINVYAVQDNGTEVLLSQPITLNAAGQPQYNGSPKQLRIELAGSDTSYCVQVFDKNGAQKLYTARVTPALDSFSGVTKAELATPNSTIVVAGVEAFKVSQWAKQVYLPEFFGAVAGEADSTSKLQATIDALPAFGVLNGGGKEYNVRTLLLKSNIEIQDIKLKTIAGATDFVSPITIIGETTAVWINGVLTTNYPQGSKTNIKLRRVGINGNRQNQTQINSPIEDGGRHGIRILGRATNITIDECSVEFCAGDGITLFSNNSRPSTEDVDALCFSNIIIDNTRMASNRRHGLAIDSAFNVKLNSVDSKRNGFDLNTTSPLNDGNRGARFAGNLYGRPFDFEGYGIGSRIVNIEIVGGDFTGNVAGALFYDTVDVTNPLFQPRKNITITGASFDESANGADAAFTVFSTTATAAIQCFDNINISNCSVDGYFNIEGAKNINVVSGSAKAKFSGNRYFARVVKSAFYFFQGVNSNKNDIFTDTLPFTATWSNIIGLPTFTSQTFTLVGFTPNGWLCRYNSSYTLAATGSLVGSIAVTGCRLIPQAFTSVVVSSGALVNMGAITSTTQLQIPYVATTTAAQNMEVIFEVVPS